MKGKTIFVVFLFIVCFHVHAQLCTGSLGDAVVKIDFGTGTSSHGTALGTGITSYTWTTADFPNDGSYTIEKTTNTPGTWWTTTDHTGGGYMMVVNASLSTTDYFYKNTVTGLCPDTTYEFAAWIMNLLRSNDTSPPNITFTIESTTGTILGTYNTGDIALNSSAVWKQYGFYFTTPTGISTVVIRMRNNKAGAAPGNDIALDDITFRACGPTVTSAIQNNTNTNLTICQGDTQSYTLTGTVSSGYSNPAYQWQVSSDNGTTWSDISGANALTYTFVPNSTAGTYLYRMAVAQSSNISSATCRVVSNMISFKVNESSTAPTFTILQPTCDVPTGTITITTTANTTYSIDGTNYQVSGIFSGLAGGDYNVTSKLNTGCASTPVIAHINSVASSSATPTFSVIQPVICSNPLGTITITSSDYEYSFDNGVTWSTSNIKSGLEAGDYWIKTRNSSNCETTAVSVSILVPPGYPPTPTVSVVQPDCISATGTITISDAATAYSFDNGVTWQVSNSKSNLVPGNYKVFIKNNLGCISLVPNEVEIKAYVNQEPLVTAVSPQLFCVQQNATLNDVSVTGQNIKWYDAPANGNLLPNSTLLESKTYYASQTIAVCESERIPVVITIQSTPAPTGDVQQDFCTTQKPAIANLTATGTNVVWYDNASNGTILSSTTSLINGATYYASQTINGCESVSRLAVSVSIVAPSLLFNNVSANVCDELNDGSEIIDLTNYNSRIAGCSSCTFTYYTTLTAAEDQIAANQITDATNYNLSAGTTLIYVRIDSNDKCYQIAELNLTLVNVPVISISDIVSLCQNKDVEVNAGSGFDSYLWSTGASTESITITEAGAYSVTVTQNHGDVICSSTKDFQVKLSNSATIQNLAVKDWTDTDNVIEVELTDASLGDYEYSIDGNTYQDSNVFSGLATGDYIVYVRDKNGCGTVNQEVFLLNYPKFFTPNEDGYNDTWGIKFSETEPEINTKIFDRYGKFIKELNAYTNWDGKLNGRELPATDYWFVVKRANGKIYKGHFTLKR
ncbi:T9SS type B sorting domain-containing protein [Flavobacterium ginsenosidimutans]|uniref:T9SS type B sorting domain-containing protein n=1 Tax=Flavobacterium ginsenosidimutans TaxID=687844 RepID=A0ABZ2QBH8_9FLAO|nr:T9SS type B sorting domain-containing protein [Flavobacterium ginsenosidimutans]KAF2329629.1 T9SS type B sorting domain-containing protein [Flavobacterium ginsenosidimutans]